MGMHGHTKGKIIDLIKKGNANLSSISKNLNLAPSTVSKHLQDLELVGIIRKKDSIYAKKWKYYELIKDNKNTDGTYNNEISSKYRVSLYAIFLVIIALGAYFYIFSIQKSTVYVPISISDPPQVPPGTQSLYINYSSISLKVNESGTTKWIVDNISGSINLMTAINVSHIIGDVRLVYGSRLEALRFNITSGRIKINNNTYPVNLIDNNITTILNNNIVNESSYILLDFYPVVVPIYNNSSIKFAMLPTLKAIVTNGTYVTNTNYTAGMQPRFFVFREYNFNHYIINVLNNNNPKVTILNKSISFNKTNMTFGITLKNNGTTNITICGVILSLELQRNESYQKNNLGSIWRGNATYKMIESGRLYNFSTDNLSINANLLYMNKSLINNNELVINVTHPLFKIKIYKNNNIDGIDSLQQQDNKEGFINFMVNSNDTLSILSNTLMYKTPDTHIAQNKSITFVYNGNTPNNYLYTNFTNITYRVVVVTTHGVIITNVSPG